MSRGKFVLAVDDETMEVQEVYPVAVAAAVAEENNPKSNQKSNFV